VAGIGGQRGGRRRPIGQLRRYVLAVHVLGTLSFAVTYLLILGFVAVYGALTLAVSLLLVRGLRRPDGLGTACGLLLTLVLVAESVPWFTTMAAHDEGAGVLRIQAGAYALALIVGAARTLVVTTRRHPASTRCHPVLAALGRPG
jgi:MFS family permease